MNLSINDQNILKKIIQRDDRVLIDFYKKYHRVIFNFVSKQISDASCCEEIVQDVFFDFIEEVRDFRGQSSIKTFLFAIAHNKAIDYIRKKKIKKILFSAIPPFILEKASAVFLDDDMEKKELAEKIKSVFARLPNDYQIILRLKYIDGERLKEIAEKLSLSFKATESLLFRARKTFVKIFQSIQ